MNCLPMGSPDLINHTGLASEPFQKALVPGGMARFKETVPTFSCGIIESRVAQKRDPFFNTNFILHFLVLSFDGFG